MAEKELEKLTGNKKVEHEDCPPSHMCAPDYEVCGPSMCTPSCNHDDEPSPRPSL